MTVSRQGGRRKTGLKNPCKVANIPIEPRDLLSLEVKARVRQGARVEPEPIAKPEVRVVLRAESHT